MSEGSSATYRWWCAFCDRTSEETYESQGEAHREGLAHIQRSEHGLTTIRTPEAE